MVDKYEKMVMMMTTEINILNGKESFQTNKKKKTKK